MRIGAAVRRWSRASWPPSSSRSASERQSAAEQLRRAQEGLEAARIARAARETELASARIEHEWRARDVRAREQELAGLAARLRSLEEMDAHRAGFADAARMVLVNANGRVGQMGALADFLEVEPRYERAVEACLGDLLQHVLVERLEHVSAGLRLIRQEDAGRCGFIVGQAGRLETGRTTEVRTGGSDRRSEPRQCPSAPCACRTSSASADRLPARCAPPSARR